MRNFKFLTPLLLSAVLFSAPTYAQRVWAPDTDATPFRPTSAELVRVSVPARGCSELRIGRNVGFRLRMVESHITLTLEESPGLWGSAPDGTFINACFPSPTGRDTFELGRLPAGDYALTIIDAVSVTQPAKAILTNKAFSVTDARTTKAAPWVRLDYSGHWWDPNDSGWGLFIWHSADDQLLAAWFTYDADGKPIWYVYQPSIPGKPNPWETFAKTYTAPLLQTSRLPGATMPPPTPTAVTTVGTAHLDFTFVVIPDGGSPGNRPFTDDPDVGRFIYTFAGGVTQTRTIKRFKP